MTVNVKLDLGRWFWLVIYSLLLLAGLFGIIALDSSTAPLEAFDTSAPSIEPVSFHTAGNLR